MKSIPIRQIKAAKEAELSENFSIRDVGAMLGGSDMLQELHRHDHFFILVLSKGKGKHEIDFTPYTICNSSVFFLRPGQVHKLTLKAGSTGYLMQFNKAFYRANENSSKQIFRSAGLRNFCKLDSIRAANIFGILAHICREFTEKQEGYSDVIKLSLGMFFIELLRGRQVDKAQTARSLTYNQERLEELSELLETHITRVKQVSQYAEMMNLSVYQLNSITRSILGKTCSELIDEQIILEAKRYLLANSGQVNQIAYSLGYEDISYFIRFFKKHTGFTPKSFRENFK